MVEQGEREAGTAGPGAANPVLVEVTRGDAVESRHRGAVAVVDAGGGTVLAAGDVERPVYARSGLKPIQALPVLESGAAEAVALTEAEIALACGSHSGEARHVAVVAGWLERIGCGAGDLECGPQRPLDQAAADALVRAGEAPSALHNNCSGQHAGFLTLARHLGCPTRGYVAADHPVQERVLCTLGAMTGLDLADAPRGIDGCGIPVIGVPLARLALAMARLAAPDGQPAPRRAAAARIRRAMAAEPFLVAGSGRFCTRIIEATGGRAILKTGAEGVYCGFLPEAGLGLALKVDDGAARAAEATVGRLLRRLGALTGEDAARLGDVLEPVVKNCAGRKVGHVRAAADCPF